VSRVDRAAVHAALADYVGSICGQAGLVLAATSRLDEVAEMDSMKWIETIAVLEARLGVEIDTHDLDAMLVVGDVVELLARARRVRRSGGGRAFP
jgi:acyl carrier protein